MAPQDKVLFDKGELKILLARPIYLVRLNECLLNDKIVIMMTWAKFQATTFITLVFPIAFNKPFFKTQLPADK